MWNDLLVHLILQNLKLMDSQRDVVTGENYTREITCSFYVINF